MAHIYSPGSEEIGFVGVMELESDMETDRHSRNPGDRTWRDNRFGLIASHNYKISWDWYKGFTLIDNLRLLWIEGSSNPHKAEGHHEPSHIGPLIKLHQGKRTGRLLKGCPYTQPISRWLGNNGKESRLLRDAHLSVARKPWERSLWFPRWAFDKANKGKVSTYFSPCKH